MAHRRTIASSPACSRQVGDDVCRHLSLIADDGNDGRLSQEAVSVTARYTTCLDSDRGASKGESRGMP